MKKLYILFLLMLLPMLASAADKVEIDGIYYELSTGETKTATVISGTNKYSGEVVIPETVTYNEETYSVTSIGGMTFLKIGNSMGGISSTGNSAFLGCTGLTSITIPNSVTSIGDGAFWGCTGLTSLTIGNNVSSIGVMAFARCNGLTSVSIPKSVTSIGNFAFYDCNNLASINVETGNTKYDSRDNCNAIIETQSNTLLLGCNNTIIPSNVTSIADKAFYYCRGLNSVNIPNGVTSIGEDAFHASGLTSVTIPNSVIYIGNLAFSNCSSLTSLTIGNNVAFIGVMAFASCSGLTSVSIPKSVTSIGNYAFYDCRDLASINVETGNTKYDSRDNCNAIIETQSNTLLSGCKNTIIPSNVISIADKAFYYCSGLTSVTIPNSLNSIGEDAFRACSGLTSIKVEGGNTKYDSRDNCNAIIETQSNTLILGCKNTIIPNGVTSIGDNAFYYCRGLTSVTVPNSVTSIGDNAFYACGLTSVTIPNSVTSIGIYAFWGCTGLTSITIPNSVTFIGGMAFKYCNKLTSVTIPNSVTSISNDLFSGCSKLTSVTIPNSVTSIGTCVFEGCIDLKDVYCYAESVPIAKAGSFAYCNIDNVSLHVPVGSVEAYKSIEPWNQFKEIIEIDNTDVDEITIKDIGKTTWCSEHDLDFTNVAGIKAYTATGYDDISKTIWLTRVMKVPAGTGLMVKGDAGAYKIPHSTVRAVYANFFKGNLGETIKIAETDGDKTNYYLSGKDGTFVSVNGNANIGKNKAYLQLPTSVFSGTRSIGISYDDEDGTTGINVQSSKFNVQSGAYYTLQGQRVVKPGKGLYIKNGKKVVIK